MTMLTVSLLVTAAAALVFVGAFVLRKRERSYRGSLVIGIVLIFGLTTVSYGWFGTLNHDESVVEQFASEPMPNRVVLYTPSD